MVRPQCTAARVWRAASDVFARCVLLHNTARTCVCVCVCVCVCRR
jgi:hypothetical protein